MTVAEIVDRARLYSRTTSSAASNDVCSGIVKDAVRQFCKDIHGIPIEEYRVVTASFDTNTSMAFNITITGGTNALAATDVVITAAARSEASGTTIASDLQTALNAAIATGDLVVSFTNFYFTIDTTASAVSTAMAIDSPDAETYLDAQELLGLAASVDVSGGVFTGDFPEDCTRRVTLSGTPISVKHVAWDRYILERGSRELFVRANTTGDPCFYWVEKSQILITPAPDTQKELYVMYKGIPSLSSINNYASGTIPTEISEDWHIALCYWTAAELARFNFENDIIQINMGAYFKKVQEYLVDYGNQNTAIEPKPTRERSYRVEG